MGDIITKSETADPIAIHVKGLSKTFQKRVVEQRSVRESIYGLFRNNTTENFKVLDDINLQIKKGETFGIVGRNGSGKSTLLLHILGALQGDKGSDIRVNGTILRLSLGMGVDPHLSARDNIYINGSILGLSFKQIGQRFGDIIEFAGIEEFVDTPVKKFSNGMKARLNFSVAIHTEADIILLDEFFGGVGDIDFREKSDLAFKEKIINNRTVVLVSHSMKLISDYCDRCIWLDKGKIMAMGKSEEIVDQYESSFKSK